ncbi:uncharacterized protein LOC142351509 [Convolutriloba macropyga]|uniref:uncharacterized protein LOC142351509 n=1 Tax=Convolutriloba macropyga TaxID=536237 RepID=UPI003F5238C4
MEYSDADRTWSSKEVLLDSCSLDNESVGCSSPRKWKQSMSQRQKLFVVMATFFTLGLIVTAVLIVSGFIMSKNSDQSQLRSLNQRLDETNKYLLNKLESLSNTVPIFHNKTEKLLAEIDKLKLIIEESSQGMTSAFDLNFTSFSDYNDHNEHKREYATASFDNIVNWNFADIICKSVDSFLAYPDASDLATFADLNATCPKSRYEETCCACWIGLNKQSDGVTWVNSNGGQANIYKKWWATGQPVQKQGYDCAYIYDGLLYNKNCQGYEAAATSRFKVSKKFVCEIIQ